MLKSNERGTITAEYAICLPVAIVFIALIITLISWGAVQAKCANAVSNVIREAITMDNPGSRDNLEILNNIALKTVGQKYADKMKLDIAVENDEWVNITIAIDVTSNALFSIVTNKISSSTVGHIE
jgi:uncharacterized protein (UPF0333 family)